jgi:hypothetical protein
MLISTFWSTMYKLTASTQLHIIQIPTQWDKPSSISDICTPVTLMLLMFFFFYSCCFHLEHRESVKHFVSIQFLNLQQSVGLLGREISLSQGHYLTQTHKKHRHPCLELNSNPWSQCSSERRRFMPWTARPLWSAFLVLGNPKYTLGVMSSGNKFIPSFTKITPRFQ